MTEQDPNYSISPQVPQTDVNVWKALESQVKPAQNPRKIARFVVFAFSIFLFVAIFVPWQQNVRGTGQVIAFDPDNRSQKIQATISGRAHRWFVKEGDKVSKGDPIVELKDNDENLVARLQSQKAAIMLQKSAKAQSIELLSLKISLLKDKQEAQLDIAEQELLNAKQDVLSSQQALSAAQIEFETNRLNLERQKELFSKGLSSQRTLELAELAFQKSQASVEQAKAGLKINQGKVRAQQSSLKRIKASTESEIRSAETSLQKANSDLADVETKLLKLETDIARQDSQTIPSPVSGTVFRVFGRSGGEQFKQGDVLASIIPQTDDRSVELFVDGRDAPLIHQGTLVRIQFEGWPALQFSGWPSIAVGTFGGEVTVVDPVDDGNGNFRILVTPDLSDDPWPDAIYLRQGVRAKGWFLLDQVALGYEVWRLFNGFPPALKNQPDEQLFHGDRL